MKLLFVLCSIISLCGGFALSLLTNDFIMMFLPLAVNLISVGSVYTIYKVFLHNSAIELSPKNDEDLSSYCSAHSL